MKYSTIIIIGISFILFFIWQILDHMYFMNLPRPDRRVISLLVDTTITLGISVFASSKIYRQFYQLKQLEQTKDDLTSMIVHDLRTPLTSIIGSLQTIQMGTFGELNPDMSEFVDISVKSGERMLNMVNDLLDISKMEAGAVKLDTELVNINELARSAVEEISYLAQDKKIKLDITVHPETLEIECDADKIRRTIINLLGNAIKFTPESGTVSILAAGNTTHSTISVSDTGEGIPAEYKDKIFEKFGQVESRKAGRQRSTGLGLTFCKLAVEAHGGNIWVDSTPGMGSVFSFTLLNKQKTAQ